MAARSSQPCPHPRHRLHRRIIIVCNEGYSSTLAAASLRTLGLNRATDLVDGYQGWLALARSRSRRATRRHRAHPDFRSVRGDHMSAPSNRIAFSDAGVSRSISRGSSVLDRAGFPGGGRCRREVVRRGPGHVSSVIRFARAVRCGGHPRAGRSSPNGMGPCQSAPSSNWRFRERARRHRHAPTRGHEPRRQAPQDGAWPALDAVQRGLRHACGPPGGGVLRHGRRLATSQGTTFVAAPRLRSGPLDRHLDANGLVLTSRCGGSPMCPSDAASAGLSRRIRAIRHA